MSVQGVDFEQSRVKKADSNNYHQGEIINGFTLDSISNINPSIRPIFNENKASRSIQNNSIENLEIGHLIDISYKRSSNSVNTPYRIADLYLGEERYNTSFDTVERDFKILLEPVIQNASLVIFTGYERNTGENPISIVEKVYYKRKWDTPKIQDFEDKDYKSEFYDVGFEERERQVTKISVLFDEVIAKVVGVEEKIVPVII